jgi:hypothetical protein
VTNFADLNYKWSSSIHTNAPDGTVDFSSFLPNGFYGQEAIWIFQDLRKAWEYIQNNTQPTYDPGPVTARWERGENSLAPCFSGSCFYAGPGGPYIFIDQNSVQSADTVVHETGHHYMFNATFWWWWDPSCWDHSMFSQEDINCAWSEGWADYFPLTVNMDPCYDFDTGPCTGTPDVRNYNLESHGRGDQYPWGDAVEGRVAGALYDIFDSTNDGYDAQKQIMDPYNRPVGIHK